MVFVIASLLSGNFLKPANLTNVLRQIVVVTVIGCGACFVLITAQINIAYDSLIACVGCTSCLVMIHTGSVFLAVIVGIALGAVIGLFYGFCVCEIVNAWIYCRSGDRYDSVGSHPSGDERKSDFRSGKIYSDRAGVHRIRTDLCYHYIWCFGRSYVLLNMTCFGRQVMAVGGNKQAAIASRHQC